MHTAASLSALVLIFAAYAQAASCYRTLVAFGASYNDNAHPRDPQYADSLRNYAPYEAFEGRYTNGPVAVEYMAMKDTEPGLGCDDEAVELLDYAYGGSVIENGVAGTGSTAPALKDQVDQFLQDVAEGTVALQAPVLFTVNTGINPTAAVWLKAVDEEMSDEALQAAERGLTDNIKAFKSAVGNLAKSDALAEIEVKTLLIVGIPPLQLLPTYAYQLPESLSPSARSRAMSELNALSTLYNSALASFTVSLRRDMRSVEGLSFRFFDLAALWYDFYAHPQHYGLTVSDLSKPAYDSSSGKISDADTSLMFDSLHPTTRVMKLWAEEMNRLLVRKMSN